MKRINIAYIGGGSRGWARTLMNDLVLEESLYGEVRLYDIDREAALMNVRIGNLYNEAEGAVTRWNYTASETLDEALDDADFVIISILPGSFDDMECDVHCPEKYGIYQSVGDTVGPGGIMRSVRAVPMYVEIARAIDKSCPEASVITYTNPMTVLTRTLYKVFPGIRAFGCCHEVFGTQRLLIAMLKEMGLAESAKRDEIKVNVLGINHFTWLDSAEYKGMDLMPVYKDFVDKYYENGFNPGGKWNDTYFSSGNRVKFDLFRRYGLIAAAGDRHLAEFCPDRYLKDRKTVEFWQFGLTPVSWRKSDLAARMEKTRKLCEGIEKPSIKNTGEEGVSLIRALAGGEKVLSNVNTINNGQHEGLPDGAVVETNAVFSREGVVPVNAGRLSPDIEKLVMRHVKNQEALVNACISGDRAGVLQVFLNDPLVRLPKQEAIELFNIMYEKNSEYLKGVRR